MHGLILAAGRGSRMGVLGDERPKCLVELEGRPLLERQVAALRRGGADSVGVDRLRDIALMFQPGADNGAVCISQERGCGCRFEAATDQD